MAYEPKLAAALSGATVSQLSHWRSSTRSSGPILVPSVSASRPILYSFEDVLALRTCAFLRKNASLHKVRRALDALGGWGPRRHLSEYTLVGDRSTIYLVEGDEAIDLVNPPGQKVIAEVVDVLKPFVSRAGLEVVDLLKPTKYVRVDPEVLGGEPVIKGTRVPSLDVADLVADGVGPAEVSEFYFSVTAEAARDAVTFSDLVDRYTRAA